MTLNSLQGSTAKVLDHGEGFDDHGSLPPNAQQRHGDRSLERPLWPIMIASLMRETGQTGLQTHVRSYLDALKLQGRRALLVTPFSQPLWQTGSTFVARWLLERVAPAAGVRWHRYWHARLLETALRRHLRDVPRCVIYAHCPVSAAAALRARHYPTQRVVMAVHFNISQADEWVAKGRIGNGSAVYEEIRAAEVNILPQLDGLVFVSQFMRDALLLRIPAITNVPTAVLPNFVSDPGPIIHDQLDGDLISIGTLEPRKNQAYLLQIIAAARQRGKKLRLTLAGDGPDRAALQKLARQLGISDQVNFMGHIANAHELLARHRACIHAATMENLPLTLVESLSYGSPVFAPAVGGIPEIFDDGVEGRRLPLDDADAAATMVTEWLLSPERMRSASLAARKRFLRSFESSLVAMRLTAFLNAIQSNP